MLTGKEKQSYHIKQKLIMTERKVLTQEGRTQRERTQKN
jgi:hypothetical protein